MGNQSAIGLYCLANDRVLDWFIAFVESWRATNARLPLTVIPFDADFSGVRALARQYGFTLLEESKAEEWEAIGRRLFPNNPVGSHTFRKFSIFEGAYEKFLFFDADIVLLEDLRCAFAGFETADCDLMYFDSNIEQVYLPGNLRDEMVTKYASHGINTGAFLSARGVLDRATLERWLDEASLVKDQFAPAAEQPYFNYCLDKERKRLRSAGSVLPALTSSTWAGSPTLLDEARQEGKWLPFIHWAGYKLDLSIPYRSCYLSYRFREAGLKERLRLAALLLYRTARRYLAARVRKRP